MAEESQKGNGHRDELGLIHNRIEEFCLRTETIWGYWGRLIDIGDAETQTQEDENLSLARTRPGLATSSVHFQRA